MKKLKKRVKLAKNQDFKKISEKPLISSENNEEKGFSKEFSNIEARIDISQFSWTFYDILKNIVISTFEILENREFSFEIPEIWHVFIAILQEIKAISHEIFIDLLVFFVDICNKIAEKLEISLYEEFEYEPFLMFFKELFCLLKPGEITERFIIIFEKAYGFLYNGCLKCLFPKKEAENVMIYAYLFKEKGNIEKVSFFHVFFLIFI